MADRMGSVGRLEKGRAGQLVLIFCLWKALLILLAAFCPGPGYDTSALILFDASPHRHHAFNTLPRYDRVALNLFRWDALYFVKAAERGQLYEQDWAFSWAYSHLLRLTGQLFAHSAEHPLRYYILGGVVISNVSHLLSVLVLHCLLLLLISGPFQRHRVAFVGSVLHILTPASLFLSAPYAEALFALLNFTGMLYYAHSKAEAQAGISTVREDAYKLSSGAFFAAAALIRSNGLLSGLILLYDVATYVPRIVMLKLSIHDMRRIFVTCMAGTFIASAFLGPQYLAYTKFCSQDIGFDVRPWCEQTIPSIYSWVQSYYWNVGLFRYWTFPNLPLFLLAAPMLWLLLESCVTLIRGCLQPLLHGYSVTRTGDTKAPRNAAWATCYLPELALPQLVLAVTALTNFHVQIVNRIASGYPIWYVTVARWLADEEKLRSTGEPPQRCAWIVRGIILYALVQGMLFANFLPPA